MFGIESEVTCLGKGVGFVQHAPLDSHSPFLPTSFWLGGCCAWLTSEAPMLTGSLQEIEEREEYGVRSFISLVPSFELTTGCRVPQWNVNALV